MFLKKHLLCFAVAIIYLFLVSASDGNFCLSSLSQSDCSENEEYLEINTTVSSCPRCRKGIAWGSPNCTEFSPCSPGLKCINGTCNLDKNTCSYTYHLHQLHDFKQLPQCESDGKFAARQCKGDKVSGRCFCYSENGSRIFGWDWNKNADAMTCACSRKRYKLESEGRVSTLHCLPNGNYETLQCDSGACWCADDKTGQIVNATRAVPQTMWKTLPCYNAMEMGTEYLRQCESMAYAQNILLQKLATHGTLDVSIMKIQCDFDGSYGTYSIHNNIASCSWRDGKTIGSFATEASLVAQMNCNCARDHLHFEDSSMVMPLICSGNGNYSPLQSLNGLLYCVDNDGFHVTEYFSELSDCNKYLYYLTNEKYNVYG